MSSATGTTVRVARALDELEPHCHAWERLYEERLEDDVYASPFFVRATLEHLHDGPFLAVFVYDGESMLAAAVFQTVPRTRELPLRRLQLLKGPHTFLTHPLLHRQKAGGGAAALCAWLDRWRNPWSLLELPLVNLESATWHCLNAALRDRSREPLARHPFARPMLQESGNFDTYLASLSSKRRSNYRRQVRRLTDLGELRVQAHRDLREAPDLADRFMALENQGWKRESGSALLQRQPDAEFFRALTGHFGERGELLFVEMRLDDRPIAMTANFVQGHTMFGFKVAHDEELSSFSPGIVNAVEEVRAVFDDPGIQRADSGAHASSFIADYWPDRAEIASVLVPTSRLAGRALLRGIPLARRIKNRLAPVEHD